MRKLLTATLLVLCAASQADAAYNLAKVKVNEPNKDGTYRIVFTFKGDAGEPDVDQEYTVSGATTAPMLRAWGAAIATGLNGTRNLATSAGLQVGQTLTLTPAATPALTAEQTWQDLARRVARLKDLGLTNATAVTEVNALIATLNSSYVTGYAADF